MKSALKFGSGTLFSRVLGFAREAYLANAFPREVTDAFNVAFRLPNMFRRLFGEGALSVSFIPVFVDLVRNDPSKRRPSELVNGVFTLLTTLIVVISLLALIFMEPIIHMLAGGEAFLSVPGKFERTVFMARIGFGFLLFITLFALFMGILNGIHQFGWSGLAPAFSNMGVLFCFMLASQWYTHETLWLGLAILLGGFFQMIVLVPSVWRSGFWPHFTKNVFNPDVLRVLKSLGPSLVGLGSLQITTVINTRFASSLPQGTVTYINNADRILEMPLSLIAVSLQTALLPTLSRFWAGGDINGMIKTSNKYLRLNYFLAVPSAVGMAVLAAPVVRVLFGWKGYGENEVLITARILEVYGLTLLTAGGVRIVSQSFYAMKNTWIPASISVVATLLHFPVAYMLTNRYGLTGLNVATLITSGTNLMLLFIWFRLRVGVFELKDFWSGFLRFLFAAGAMAGVILYLSQYLSADGIQQNKLFSFMSLIFLCVTGGAVYFGVCKLLRVEEATVMLNRFFKRRG